MSAKSQSGRSISVLMVGVGGQGIVLASNILCNAAMKAGYDVKKSEIHGMAQRGGSVVSHVRFGSRVYSPAIPSGSADYILSFERMEFLRYMRYASPETKLILNSRKILPPSVAWGKEKYPDELISSQMNVFCSIHELDAGALAEAAGNVKAAGTVILGALAGGLDIDRGLWEEAVTLTVPTKAKDVNIAAFRAGMGL